MKKSEYHEPHCKFVALARTTPDIEDIDGLREIDLTSVSASNRFGCCERRVWLFPPSDGRGSG
jgi:hypothetical protein